MKELAKGITGTSELTVTDNELAVNVGSGSLEVFATPVMIMLMEKAACNCIAEYLEGDETVKSQVKHTIFRQKIYKPFATKYTRLMRDGLAVREAV